MSGNSSLQHRPDIDGLRAVAVLAVVAYHVTKRIPGGYVGVDIFFVISGFLISSIILDGLERNTFSPADFYARRIRRIFPALLLVLLCSWLLGWFVLSPQSYALLGRHMVAGAGFFSNLLLWSESGYFDPAATLKPLLHLWSLGIEEQFYLVWPLLLIVAARWKWRVHLTILVLLGISFVFNIAGVQASPVATFYLPPSRFWELLMGALLAYMHLQYSAALERGLSCPVCQFGETRIPFRSLVSWLGLALIVGAILGLNDASRFPGWWALLPTLGSMMLISAGSHAWFNRTVLSHRWLVTIGLLSYPLYLWHWPLLTLGRMTLLGMDYPRLTALGMVVLSLLLSALTYRYIEKPLRYGVKWKLHSVVKCLLGAMIFVGAMGAVTSFQKGWSSRYPLAIRPFLDYQFDYQESFRNHRCLLAGSERDFASECTAVDAGMPMVMIWGDSHGAMLYRALDEAARKEGVSVAQLTSSSCPPILNFDKGDRPLCRPINEDIFKKIVQLKPHTLVLAHDWPQSLSEHALEKLPATIQKLRMAGVQRIVLMGPVPHWGRALPTVIVQHVHSKNLDAPPERILSELQPTLEMFDAQLSGVAKELSLEYISPMRDFCNAEGCMISLGQPSEPTAFDDAHLTGIAARYVVQKNMGKFLQGK